MDQITLQSIVYHLVGPETSDYAKLRAINHEQHLTGHVGTPEDIALPCLYLTNPTNRFVTGTNLTADGGMIKKMIYEE